MTAKTWPNGVQEWFDDQGWCHRDGDLPASIHPDGSRAWFRHGKLHRETGPAYIDADGTESFWLNGKCLDLNPLDLAPSELITP